MRVTSQSNTDAAASPAELPPLPAGILCPECGYDLRGLTSARCSECGFDVTLLRRGESQIPWCHRKQLGRLRAYWKTVWQVLRHPKRVYQEMARPVSYADSQSFRWVTTLHVYLTVLAGSIAWYAFNRRYGWVSSKDEETMWWLLAGLNLWAAMFYAGRPGLASYFFQSKQLPVEQQNRAIALSYYAWAPLALTPLVLPIVIAAWLTWTPWGASWMVLLAAGLVYVVLEAIAHESVERIHRHTMFLGTWPWAWRVAILPVIEFLFGVLLLLLPGTVFYLLVIYHSLR